MISLQKRTFIELIETFPSSRERTLHIPIQTLHLLKLAPTSTSSR